MKWGLQMTTYIVKDGGNRKLPF
ncbi:hypothetical protein, partial [Listeria monocytogenes]